MHIACYNHMYSYDAVARHHAPNVSLPRRLLHVSGDGYMKHTCIVYTRGALLTAVFSLRSTLDRLRQSHVGLSALLRAHDKAARRRTVDAEIRE